jgi:hypothetical protein
LSTAVEEEGQPFDKLREVGVGGRTIPLATGTLHLEVDRALWPLDTLCDFAVRRNPRRAFLIVSKVLGRHIPAAPSLIRASVRDLAAQVPADLRGPVLVVGLAETAVCLGQSVFEELARRPGFTGHFIHSTRQQIDHPLLCRFEEPHSHASAHLIYRPVGVDLAAVGTLILVDDEVSTGTTLVNLAEALVAHLPRCERIVAASLTDWSGGGDWLGRMVRPAACVSLLSGRMRWEAGAGPPPADAWVFDRAAPALGRMVQHRNYGRLGWDGDALPISAVDLTPGRRLRVVATGEFTYPPFRLAEMLEAAGHDVVMQSTSRSPALPGRAIGHILAFEDNYATGLPNFLYNADPADGRDSLICHETPPDSIDAALIAALKATCISF